MLVGGIRSLGVAEKLIEQGVTDYISMSRPFIRQPDLIKKWMAGQSQQATCISDCLCQKTHALRQRRGIFCAVEDALQNKKS